MNETAGKIIIDGNSAAALGCMFAGVTVVTWYPITPSSSLVESLIDYMKEYRVGPDGKATFAIVQAEDELAAIGMVLGAGWAGARSMTATAGPGHFADGGVRRTGLLRRDSRRDLGHAARGAVDRAADAHRAGRHLLSWRTLSHGDTKHPMLLPCIVGGVLQHGERGLRSGRAVADAGVRHVAISTSA